MVAEGDHSHTVGNTNLVTGNHTPAGLDGTANEHDNIQSGTTTTSVTGSHTHAINNTGIPAVNIINPFLTMNYIIKY
jgi:hypothetical protein